MKTKLLIILFVLLALWVALVSTAGEVVSIPEFGACGAPGDPEATCATCHNTSEELEVDIELSLQDLFGTPVTYYAPGEIYHASVTIAVIRGQPTGYGFQTIALKAPLYEDGEDVDGFSDPEENVKIVTASFNRRYAEHNGVSQDSVFRFYWTAPTDANGYVSFFACGNGVNGDGTNQGDKTACTKVEFREQPVSINDLHETIQLKITPNPVANWLNLSVISTKAMMLTATIFAADGRKLKSFPLELTAGMQQRQLVANDLPSGLYVLRLSEGHQMTTVRFVKE